ncbi:hypothetical protein GVAV_000220 [Gurleya vavrai]
MNNKNKSKMASFSKKILGFLSNDSIPQIIAVNAAFFTIVTSFCYYQGSLHGFFLCNYLLFWLTLFFSATVEKLDLLNLFVFFTISFVVFSIITILQSVILCSFYVNYCLKIFYSNV